MKTFINERDLQVSGYPSVLIIIRPDPEAYLMSGITTSGTNDATPETILNEILQEHSIAWKKLADL